MSFLWMWFHANANKNNKLIKRISFVFKNSDIDGIRNGARLEPRVIAKAPEGQGCPRCGGYVYAAEQMLARGRVS